MKYFTKDWYELCGKTDCYFLIEEDENAEEFSDEYYEKLYNQRLEERLIQAEKFYNFQKENYTEITHSHKKPFNKNQVKEQFHNAFLSNQERYKKVLPPEILNQIADIRVYTLEKATKKVLTAVKAYCENNQRKINKVFEDYRQYIKAESFDKELIRNMSFHDSKIIEIKKKDNYLLIKLDNYGGFTDIDEIMLSNYKIIKEEPPYEAAYWLYDELYKVNGSYELHILLMREDGSLADFIISAKEILLSRNGELI